ncbi:MAG: stage II sporulation protein D [Ruminococcaceae bacterium]|nr:stage II sporulation protein D [Oscillospiraceae bacterium]
MKRMTVYLVCFLFAFILLPATILATVITTGIGKKYEIVSNAQTDIGQLSIGSEGIDKAIEDAGLSSGGKNEPIIRVYFKGEDISREMLLEEYIAGVIIGEMRLSFGVEAIKAQAVASRTYTLHKILNGGAEDVRHKDGAVICDDYTHCQAWRDINTIFTSYPEKQANEYYNKVMKAVQDTKGQVMSYNGEIVKAYYFSNGGGYTESIEDVWDSDAIEYLQSVPSVGDITSDSYCTVETFTPEEFKEKLKSFKPEIEIEASDIYESIENCEKSESGRVKNITIGGVGFKGTELRTCLGLRSTNFIFRQSAYGEIIVVVFGSGHGVGMSQWGAGVMAASGSLYDEILLHYYQGVSIVDCSEFSF